MSTDSDNIRFGFGRNWSDFIAKHFNEDRVRTSKEQLLNFLKYPDLKGKTFLDIGCGSGIHSLAALRAGASHVFSFDYDIDSVKTAEFIKEREGNPENWTIQQGSVLDEKFMYSLPKSDIVYSWGVLHHTGSMWNAIRNATIPLKENSLFFIALYSHDMYINPTADFWIEKKKKYNQLGKFGKKYMELWYYINFMLIPDLRGGVTPWRRFNEYKGRGMDLWTDVVDWIGGWPMEFVKIMEMQEVADKEFGMELLNMNSVEANAEFLFRKKGYPNENWDKIIAGTKNIPLNKPFEKLEGNCWKLSLPEFESMSDSCTAYRKSPLIMFENSFRLPLNHSSHDNIIKAGKGRYSHWGKEILFSTTDNSDPNNNGRDYYIKIYPESAG